MDLCNYGFKVEKGGLIEEMAVQTTLFQSISAFPIEIMSAIGICVGHKLLPAKENKKK